MPYFVRQKATADDSLNLDHCIRIEKGYTPTQEVDGSTTMDFYILFRMINGYYTWSYGPDKPERDREFNWLCNLCNLKS